MDGYGASHTGIHQGLQRGMPLIFVLACAVSAPAMAATPLAGVPRTAALPGSGQDAATAVDYSAARDISADGLVVGQSSTPSGQPRAFLWTPWTREMTSLGTLEGHVASNASAINSAGYVVGDSCARSGRTCIAHAFLWSPRSRTMTDLGTLGGELSFATGINDRRQVVGVSTTRRDRGHAFLWRPATQEMTDLGTLGGRSSQAFAVNNRGQVVGQSTTSLGRYRAFLWRPRTQTMVNLGTFGEGANEVVALDINDRGQIVGYLYDRSGFKRAFLWRPLSQTMTDLGSLDDGDTTASGINDNGQVVGASRVAGWWRAFLWRPRTNAMTDLGSIGRNSAAVALNERGWVVGSSGGHATLWKPTAQTIVDLGVLSDG